MKVVKNNKFQSVVSGKHIKVTLGTKSSSKLAKVRVATVDHYGRAIRGTSRMIQVDSIRRKYQLV